MFYYIICILLITDFINGAYGAASHIPWYVSTINPDVKGSKVNDDILSMAQHDDPLPRTVHHTTVAGKKVASRRPITKYSQTIISYQDPQGCPFNHIPQISTTGPKLCSINEVSRANGCSQGYKCIFSCSHQRYQCCMYNSGCPLGQETQVDASTGTFRSCDRKHGCSSGFECIFTRGVYKGTCCRTQPAAWSLDGKGISPNKKLNFFAQQAQQNEFAFNKESPPSKSLNWYNEYYTTDYPPASTDKNFQRSISDTSNRNGPITEFDNSAAANQLPNNYLVSPGQIDYFDYVDYHENATAPNTEAPAQWVYPEAATTLSPQTVKPSTTTSHNLWTHELGRQHSGSAQINNARWVNHWDDDQACPDGLKPVIDVRAGSNALCITHRDCKHEYLCHFPPNKAFGTCCAPTADVRRALAKIQSNKGFNNKRRPKKSRKSSSKKITTGKYPKICIDFAQDCASLVLNMKDFCSHPSWAYFASVNCYNTCFC